MYYILTLILRFFYGWTRESIQIAEKVSENSNESLIEDYQRLLKYGRKEFSRFTLGLGSKTLRTLRYLNEKNVKLLRLLQSEQGKQVLNLIEEGLQVVSYAPKVSLKEVAKDVLNLSDVESFYLKSFKDRGLTKTALDILKLSHEDYITFKTLKDSDKLYTKHTSTLMSLKEEDQNLLKLLVNAPPGVKSAIEQVLEKHSSEKHEQCYEEIEVTSLLENITHATETLGLYVNSNIVDSDQTQDFLKDLIIENLILLDRLSQLEEELDSDEGNEIEEYTYESIIQLTNGVNYLLHSDLKFTRETPVIYFKKKLLPKYLEGCRKFTVYKKPANYSIDGTIVDRELYLGQFILVKSDIPDTYKFVNKKEVSELNWTLEIKEPTHKIPIWKITNKYGSSTIKSWQSSIHYLHLNKGEGTKTFYVGEWRCINSGGELCLVPTRKTSSYLDEVYEEMFRDYPSDWDTQDDLVVSRKLLHSWDESPDMIFETFAQNRQFIFKYSTIEFKGDNKNFELTFSTRSIDKAACDDLFGSTGLRYCKVSMGGELLGEFECVKMRLPNDMIKIKCVLNDEIYNSEDFTDDRERFVERPIVQQKLAIPDLERETLDKESIEKEIQQIF